MTSTLCSQEIATMFLMVILKLDESDLRVNCLSKKKKKREKSKVPPQTFQGGGGGGQQKTGKQENKETIKIQCEQNLPTLKQLKDSEFAQGLSAICTSGKREINICWRVPTPACGIDIFNSVERLFTTNLSLFHY